MRNDQGLMFHLLIKEGDIGRYVLMPGDPGRVAKIASFLDDSKPVAQHREYTTYTGSLLGEKVSVISTGIGCPSTAIAVEEAIEAGADTMIRVGTSGSMQPNIHTGDLAVITGAIRDEGTTRAYLPIEFPAVASLEVVNALIEGCKTLGVPFHSGISHSKDSFYGEVERTRMPMAELLGEKWDAYVTRWGDLQRNGSRGTLHPGGHLPQACRGGDLDHQFQRPGRAGSERRGQENGDRGREPGHPRGGGGVEGADQEG